ncbi:MAG: GntR family transcriptional regulator, partial [Hyphomicrobiaceae bacterium]|nr:GntR family transcriptional regulator [Hyphomicrobiaceae bacterium]
MAQPPTPAPSKGRAVRRPLSAQLSATLRQMILAGDLEPGERLQEADLSARFGVSRTPLREALKVLAAEGLVTLLPNRGASVTALTPEEVAET